MTKRIYVVDGEGFGDARDVTDAMAALYDLAIQSMDYGSGFWSYEDAVPVAEMAELMDWEGSTEIIRYRDNQLYTSERSDWIRKTFEPPYPSLWDVPFVTWTQRTATSVDGSTFVQNIQVPAPHEHVYGTLDKCFWPQCEVRRQD
jgi:hypothetical protein